MISIPCKRVFLVKEKIDFRKQLNGLLNEAYKRGFDPYSGDCLTFIHKDGGSIKIITGDAIGLYGVTRRFEKGAISKSFLIKDSDNVISSGELGMLLEGKVFLVVKKVRPWRKCTKKSHQKATSQDGKLQHIEHSQS